MPEISKTIHVYTRVTYTLFAWSRHKDKCHLYLYVQDVKP